MYTAFLNRQHLLSCPKLLKWFINWRYPFSVWEPADCKWFFAIFSTYTNTSFSPHLHCFCNKLGSVPRAWSCVPVIPGGVRVSGFSEESSVLETKHTLQRLSWSSGRNSSALPALSTRVWKPPRSHWGRLAVIPFFKRRLMRIVTLSILCWCPGQQRHFSLSTRRQLAAFQFFCWAMLL